MKVVARIDSDGYFVEDVVLQEGEELPVDCIEERPNTSERGFYKAKWTGTEWIEGLGQEEIDAIESRPNPPTFEDYLVNLDFRLSLVELGLI